VIENGTLRRIRLYNDDYSKVFDGWFNPIHVIAVVPQEHAVPDSRGGKKLEMEKHLRMMLINGTKMDVPHDQMSVLDSCCNSTDSGPRVYT
jgi:hypothetical protein